jgi:hypothetical protein
MRASFILILLDPLAISSFLFRYGALRGHFFVFLFRVFSCIWWFQLLFFSKQKSAVVRLTGHLCVSAVNILNRLSKSRHFEKITHITQTMSFRENAYNGIGRVALMLGGGVHEVAKFRSCEAV